MYIGRKSVPQSGKFVCSSASSRRARPSKKRRGKTDIISCTASASSSRSRTDPEQILKSAEKTSTSKSIQDENIHNTLIKNNIISKYKNIPDNLEKNLFLLLYQNNTNIFISKF